MGQGLAAPAPPTPHSLGTISEGMWLLLSWTLLGQVGKGPWVRALA